MTPGTRSGPRTALGVAAIFVLLSGAALVPNWGTSRQMAVVEAGQTFQVTSEGSGSWAATLTDGRPARGGTIRSQRVLAMDRADLVELTLAPGLATGQRVAAGETLGRLRAPRAERRLAEARAVRDALQARRDLLAAGARDADVAVTQTALRVARAEHQAWQPEVARLRTLVASGAVSQAELQTAELRSEVLAAQVALASAEVEAARSPARPEALHEVDAEIDAVEAALIEAEELAGELLTSPIDGVLELGGAAWLLRIYDLDTVYLRIPVPEHHRNRLRLGAPVRFSTRSADRQLFLGEVVDLSVDAGSLPTGTRVFWASAEIDNEAMMLRSGMTGQVDIQLDDGSEGLIGALWHDLVGA